MSDLGAAVKEAADDAGTAGGDAGKDAMEHYEDIGSGLKTAAGRYRSVESDSEQGFKNIADGGTSARPVR